MPIIAGVGAFLGTAAGAATASAAVGAAGSIYAAGQQKKATDKAINAQNTATQQQLALQQQQYDQTRADQSPYRQTGYAALDALAAQYGLTPNANSGGPSAGYDVGAYIAQNPDVAARAQELQAAGEIGPNGQWKTAEEWVGQVQMPNAIANGEQRAYPRAAQAAPPQSTQAQGADPMTAAPPSFTRPEFASAPDASTYFGEYTESPEYEYLRDKSLKALNNSFGARGVLRSGGAARELLKEASGLAALDRQNWFNRQNVQYQSALQQFNLDRNFSNANYESDRGYGTGLWQNQRDYATGRQDQRTNDLFKLAGAGQSALTATQNAGASYAANSGNAAQNQASALAGLYGQQASNSSALAGALSGFGQSALSNYGGGRMGSYTPVTLQTSGVTPAYQTVFNPGPLKTIPQVNF